MAHQTERYHSLDFLRAFAMFLGILLHAAISFAATPVPFWPVRDEKNSQATDLLIFVVHDFRMQTFFFLAGFFGSLLYQRYRFGGMMRHRLQRVVVPFGLALLLIQPTLQALWLLGNPKALRYIGITFDASQPKAELLAEHFFSGRFLQYLYPFHLWFLYFLILFFFAMLPLLGMAKLLSGTRLGNAADRSIGKIASVPGRSFLLAALTAPLLWRSKVWGMVDTPEGWEVHGHVLGYYFLFFVAGWLLWTHRESLPNFTRRWALSLVAANALVMPALLLLVISAVEGLQGKAERPGIEHRIATCYLSALYSWLMIGGLMGAFRRYFDRERPWIRYLADASYWCYLWHLTPIIALQMLLAETPLPGIVKFSIVAGGSLAILIASYEWGVRYTLIGALLNGRKHRRQC